MKHKKRNIINNFYTKVFHTLILTLFLCIFIPSNIYSQEADSFSISQYGLGKLVDFAYGLVGKYDLIDRKDTISNINNQTDKLLVLGVDFRSHASSALESVVNSKIVDDSSLLPQIIETPLVYPNPFRQSISEGAILSYTMNKDFDVEIHMYNMLSQRVFKQSFLSGSIGARKGDNRLKINNESLLGYNLSAGVYFFVIINDGNVLSKGKMVVKP